MPKAAIEAVRRRDPLARLGLAICVGLLVTLAVCGGLWWRATNAKRVHLTLFFRETVHGVEVGSPVKILGVPAGQIEMMGVRLPAGKDGEHHAAVKVALDGELLAAKGLPRDLDRPERLREEIRRGLRGRLRLVSPMTGDMYLELAYLPEDPAALVSAPSEGVAEVPTLPDPLSRGIVALTHRFGELEGRDFDGLERELSARLDRIGALADPESVREANEAVLAKLEQVRVAIANPRLRAKLAAVNEDLARARRALAAFDTGAGAASFVEAAAKLRLDLAEVRAETGKIGDALDPRSPALLSAYVRLATLRDDAARVRALCGEISGANGLLELFLRSAGEPGEVGAE